MAAPLTADQLVKALTAEGLTVHEVRSWRTHNRNSKGAWGPLNGVMLHHTASAVGEAVSVTVARCYDGRSDLAGPLCHGVIDRRGEVWLVGNGRANHAGGGDGAVLNEVIAESYGTKPPATRQHEGSTGAVDGNARFYGFECINAGDGSDPWPDAQVQAMAKAATAICRAHGWTEKSTIGHLEWSDWKPDPRGAAVAMPTLRGYIAAALGKKPGEWRLKAPAPAPAPSSPTASELLAVVEKTHKTLGDQIAALRKKIGA
ncbi:peptidoglycan recognition protein family protein [Streptomyces tagetis]|uniref:N-acetylmuramoyl-L-alanine amidase n=1 Tax=Streptomyces tagetis TaxID=2820809 RepID=A0A940XJN5_9ACTN|nr:peptidoglycan recognition family protein [Streptomyces sp. RG38]MBQ0827721.1 N-acetylmuramoyl-L-alanine amidase [Streptomyces sp. RG38]